MYFSIVIVIYHLFQIYTYDCDYAVSFHLMTDSEITRQTIPVFATF